jgi:hypothetical protein
MTVSALAATGSQDLWFVSRASGLVLLVLFSIVVVLGVWWVALTEVGSAAVGAAVLARIFGLAPSPAKAP